MNGPGPLDLSIIIARLREDVLALRQVGGAADYVEAYKRPGELPAAFVVLNSEDIVTTPMSGGVLHHKVTAAVDVAVAVRNYSAAKRGVDQMDTLRPIVGSVRMSLNGWRPVISDADEVEAFRGNGRARVLRYDADVLWWADRFTVVYHHRFF